MVKKIVILACLAGFSCKPKPGEEVSESKNFNRSQQGYASKIDQFEAAERCLDGKQKNVCTITLAYWSDRKNNTAWSDTYVHQSEWTTAKPFQGEKMTTARRSPRTCSAESCKIWPDVRWAKSSWTQALLIVRNALS